MNEKELIQFLKDLVADAVTLKNKYLDANLHNIPVNYACIFAHNDKEYEVLHRIGHSLGDVIKETEMGDLFHIKPFETVAGDIKLIKIRKPDPNKPQRGYADFTVPDYSQFKKKYLEQLNFKLTDRKTYEIIGISDPEYDVRVYFAYPPLDEQLGLV